MGGVEDPHGPVEPIRTCFSDLTGLHLHLTPRNEHSTTLACMEAEPAAAIKRDSPRIGAEPDGGMPPPEPRYVRQEPAVRPVMPVGGRGKAWPLTTGRFRGRDKRRCAADAAHFLLSTCPARHGRPIRPVERGFSVTLVTAAVATSLRSPVSIALPVPRMPGGPPLTVPWQESPVSCRSLTI